MILISFFLVLASQLTKEASVAFAQDPATPVEYEERWFETRVDHYGFINNDKFMLRYIYSDKYYKPGGPILFYPGNEGSIEDFVKNTGFIWEFAPDFCAMILFVEHRYYGKSLPYQNVTEDKRMLNYLTIEQAMSDFIDLLSTEFPNQKVIAIGGSYGGMLAAWMRTRYPEYITGALASSAPVYQFEGLSDCSGPYDTVTASYGKSFENSPANIRRMWNVLGQRSNDTEYMEYLWQRLNLCEFDEMNMEFLIEYLELIFFNMAMVNYPTPADLLVPLPAYPVYLVSSFFSSPNMEAEDFEMALAYTLNLYFNYTGNSGECFNLANTNGEVDDFYWTYQYCTQMDMYICSRESSRNMFRPFAYNRTANTESCQNKYGVSPDSSWLPREFNIRDMSSLSNIIFSNAEFDPWMPGGVLEDINDSVVAIFMTDAAHHLDLRTSSPNDPPSVIAAREREIAIIRQWLTDSS